MVNLIEADRKVKGVSNNHSLYRVSAEEQLWTHKTSNFEVYGLHQKKPTPVPHKETEATKGYTNWTTENWKNISIFTVTFKWCDLFQ